MNQLCACGCGKEVKIGNTYINGHNKSTLNVSCMRDISYNRQKSHKEWVKVKKLTNNVKNRKEKTQK